MRTFRRTTALFVCATFMALLLVGCNMQTSGGDFHPTSLKNYPVADMSSYNCAEGYEGPYRFIDMTVAEVAQEMDAGSTFVLYTGYNQCPWCNSMLNYLNDVALEYDIDIAYVDTRKDPSWQSNLDLADYDLFVERFGSALSEDEDGIPHLYVPHIFFVKDGQLVDDHSGTVTSQEESSDPLSEEQIAEFKSIIVDGLKAMGL